MTNIHRPVFEDAVRPTGAPARGSRRARLGWQLGAERIGMSLWEVPARQPADAYHYHLASEEIVIVLVGRLLLRTPEGERSLVEGDAVCFPAGEAGAHRLTNHEDEPARLLAVSNYGLPDVVVWPESQKLGIFELRAGGPGLRAIFRLADATMYLGAEGRESP
jgi:uncharacterized cupin superfamily protein